ncbi:hypothetical protein [Klebsiella quasivariicola]|uniref:hypothetical protein n=1 Tax=Klebsiella quasivariicola TaxID=2026240 RepID=UPI0024791D2B|nr:hypothetical protein [Klebsiella quasivariicola]
MNAIKMNYTALANTARECAQLANGVSGTMKWIVSHWNLCCQQSDLLTFTTEARYTRRAALAADMLRMAEQLDRLANDCDAITGEPVAPVEAAVEAAEPEQAESVVEIDARDIQVGMWVQNPLVPGQFQQVEHKAQYGEYVVIQFSWNMGLQSFDAGETLIVRASNGDVQITDVLINEDVNMTTFNTINVGDVFRANTGAILVKRSNTTYSFNGSNTEHVLNEEARNEQISLMNTEEVNMTTANDTAVLAVLNAVSRAVISQLNSHSDLPNITGIQESAFPTIISMRAALYPLELADTVRICKAAAEVTQFLDPSIHLETMEESLVSLSIETLQGFEPESNSWDADWITTASIEQLTDLGAQLLRDEDNSGFESFSQAVAEHRTEEDNAEVQAAIVATSLAA